MGTAEEADNRVSPVEITMETRSNEDKSSFNEKHDNEVISVREEYDSDEAAKIYVPDDNEEYIDPRLKDYPVPLVAKTVDLHNDFK
jgi:hypothetical protein